MESPEEYEVSILRLMSYEQLLGDVDNPGPLVTLAYPEILRLREVSRKFRDIIDTDYFWELKTRRDFGVSARNPKEESWKKEYHRYGQELASELIDAIEDTTRSPRKHGAPIRWLGDKVRVRELLDLGVNPNIKSLGIRTVKRPLITASRNGDSDIVKMLLEAGANPNVTDNSRIVSLFWASKNGYADIVEMLLDAGADPNIQSYGGHKPLDHATSRDIIKMLRNAGARYSKR